MISVIIVNYNTKAILLKCIESLIEDVNELKGEIVVVDNNSTDDSESSIRYNFPTVRVIRNKFNFGYAKAVNQGILATKNPYLLVVNSDTISERGGLRLLLKFMEENPKAGMASPMLIRPDLSIDPCCKRAPSIRWELVKAIMLDLLFPKSHLFRREVDPYLSKRVPTRVDEVAGTYMLIRRAALDQVGLMDEDFFLYFEDQELCKRFRDQGWGIFSSPM